MSQNFNLDTLQTAYNSLLDFIGSNEEYIIISNNVTNIWKTTDHNFIKLLSSFFAEQHEDIRPLIPSSKLFLAIVSFSEKNNNHALLSWIKSFNNCFLSYVSNAMKKTKTKVSDPSNFLCHVNQELKKCSDMFNSLKLKNEYLEKYVEELKQNLQVSEEKNAFLTNSLEHLADEECENFRKRMRTKIISLNTKQTTTV